MSGSGWSRASTEEAGQYIATFKQFEHKAPDLIKEHVDKDYTSTLWFALTSISKVNKTDVKTLHTSIGVHHVFIWWWLCLNSTLQSFADIAKAPSDRLQHLPGFGQVKVKRLKEAFEKPFRNSVTSATFSLGVVSTSTRDRADDMGIPSSVHGSNPGSETSSIAET